jgi:hypothetical protein
MLELRQAVGISFTDLEVNVFKHLQAMFVKTMQEILESIDDEIFRLRDQSRYVVKDCRNATVTTLLGDVSFRRRYYIDKPGANYKYLLDEVLEFGGGERISPALKVVAAMQAVSGPSYRAARDSLERFYGHRVLSHEGIRQIVLRVGKTIEKDVNVRNRCDGETPGKKVPILFLESDGWHIPLQKHRKSSMEAKMLMSHEGWKRRTPGSSEYMLAEKTYYQDIRSGSDEFWDASSRNLYSKYDIDEDTLVILNGDRAPWIRKGLEYFPNAMYQVDRFHVKRDIKRLLVYNKKALKQGLTAFDRSDVEGLVDALKQGMKTAGGIEAELEIAEFIKVIRAMPESFRDYRVRLSEKGYDVSGLRGIGAAESSVDRFSDRIKKRGQSWGEEGLKAILYAMVKNFEGKLEPYVRSLISHEESVSENLDREIKRTFEKVKRDALRVKHGGTPIKTRGTNRSAGLSQLFWRLDYADSLIK